MMRNGYWGGLIPLTRGLSIRFQWMELAVDRFTILMTNSRR
ncbi:unnamed protein product [Tuwongella immobilis]|uniref:Uncharacterized protein n=1 Tax=Tuwongella immobilis TaxID=692036 RepID=A0A6C2YHF5_9BACT|nr:unnamed protein product [Tuwongella immobilis]VTR96816.1 unnamed protein product [Tuwongella immobilis]